MPPPPGTRLVFIDAGAEGGRAGDWFWSAPPLLFGARAHVTSPSPTDYDAYVFATDAEVVANVTARQSAGARVTVIEAVAGATDAPAVAAGPAGRPARPATVDFAAWLGRTFGPTDYLLCRLDLEGGETAVVRRLLRAGLLCRCARLSIEWHMWVGTRDAPHGVHFNHPPSVGEDGNVFAIDGAAAQGGVTCTIPHLGKALPLTECMLPKVLAWARRDCPPPAAPMERWV